MKIKTKIDKSEKIVASIIEMQKKIERLKPLTPVESAKLEHSIAIEQLYYSSKIEGTNLSEKAIDKAIHGKREATTS